MLSASHKLNIVRKPNNIKKVAAELNVGVGTVYKAVET